MIPARTFLTRTAGWFRREEGNATVEFALMLPVVLTVFLSTVEAGFMMTRSVLLERALDLSVRDLRLGVVTAMSHDQLKQRVCNRMSLVPDCMNVMKIELRPVNTTNWTGLATMASCVDRGTGVAPPADFVVGAENELMIIRACMIVDPIFPTSGYGLKMPLDASGGFRLAAVSAFVNEPRT